MRKTYLITGIENGEFQRATVNVENRKTKLDAIKIYNDKFPKAFIISVCRLEQEEYEWILKNNLPNRKDIVHSDTKDNQIQILEKALELACREVSILEELRRRQALPENSQESLISEFKTQAIKELQGE